MDSKKVSNTYIIRINKGEKIITTLTSFCFRNNITLGRFAGIGAVHTATIGSFNPSTKKYSEKVFNGIFEVVSLNGNISTMEEAPYIHAHIVIADDQFKTYGGHLSEAEVSATCEIHLEALEDTVSRTYSDEIGLNLYDY